MSFKLVKDGKSVVRELTEFETGRLYERREARDQLIAIAQIADIEQQREIMWAWLTEIMDNLPDEPVVISIEETYLVRID